VKLIARPELIWAVLLFESIILAVIVASCICNVFLMPTRVKETLFPNATSLTILITASPVEADAFE
jgi:hypothetical protein